MYKNDKGNYLLVIHYFSSANHSCSYKNKHLHSKNGDKHLYAYTYVWEQTPPGVKFNTPVFAV